MTPVEPGILLRCQRAQLFFAEPAGQDVDVDEVSGGSAPEEGEGLVSSQFFGRQNGAERGRFLTSDPGVDAEVELADLSTTRHLDPHETGRLDEPPRRHPCSAQRIVDGLDDAVDGLGFASEEVEVPGLPVDKTLQD